MQFREISRKSLLEKENIVLIFILFCILGMIIHGETLIQIPRYYSIEITDNNGVTEWVFVREENRFDHFSKGEDNAFWEPPCIAEDQSDTNTAPAEVMEAYGDDVVPGDYEYLSALENVINETHFFDGTNIAALIRGGDNLNSKDNFDEDKTKDIIAEFNEAKAKEEQ